MNIFVYFINFLFPDVDRYQLCYAFPNNRNSIINRDFIYYSFINVVNIELVNYSTKRKFTILQNVLDNSMICLVRKNFILYNFCKAQRHYWALNKFAYACKYKKTKIYDNDVDLYMRPLSNYKPHIIITILHDNIKYVFKISDLITIINKSLSNSTNFFCEPQYIKNPYTNVRFTNAILYSIYYFIKDSSYLVSILFHQYFMTGFDLSAFAYQNESLLRDISIHEFIRNGTYMQRKVYTENMLHKYKDVLLLNIQLGFPSVYVIDAFKKYLKDYLFSMYSLNPELKLRAEYKLTRQLVRFARLNPYYGIRHNNLDASCTLFNNHVNTHTPPITPRGHSARTQTLRVIPDEISDAETSNSEPEVSDSSDTVWTAMSDDEADSTNETSGTLRTVISDSVYYEHLMRFREVLNEIDNSSIAII